MFLEKTRSRNDISDETLGISSVTGRDSVRTFSIAVLASDRGMLV